MKLLHNVMIKTHHVRTALQDINDEETTKCNEATATHTEVTTCTTHNGETTQNNDKKIT